MLNANDLIEQVVNGTDPKSIIGLTEAKITLPKGFVDRIAKMTDSNQHTKADLEIAEMVRNKRMIPALEAYITLHKFYGSKDQHLVAIGNNLYDQNMAYAKAVLSDEDYKALHGAK